MEFTIPDKEITENIIDFGRKVGYFPIGRGKHEAEFSFVRKLYGSDYPRYHLLIRKDKGKSFLLNIHLDQKKPIYGKYPAHSAQYDGPLIENEIDRIKSLL